MSLKQTLVVAILFLTGFNIGLYLLHERQRASCLSTYGEGAYYTIIKGCMVEVDDGIHQSFPLGED